MRKATCNKLDQQVADVPSDDSHEQVRLLRGLLALLERRWVEDLREEA